MTSLALKVGTPKMIHLRMKMILTTLCMIKVEPMTMKKPTGLTVMITMKMPSGETEKEVNQSIVKVGPHDLGDWHRNWDDTDDHLGAIGDPDDDGDAEWRDGDYDHSIDSEGKFHTTDIDNDVDTNESLRTESKPHETYHGESTSE